MKPQFWNGTIMGEGWTGKYGSPVGLSLEELLYELECSRADSPGTQYVLCVNSQHKDKHNGSVFQIRICGGGV